MFIILFLFHGFHYPTYLNLFHVAPIKTFPCYKIGKHSDDSLDFPNFAVLESGCTFEDPPCFDIKFNISIQRRNSCKLQCYL